MKRRDHFVQFFTNNYNLVQKTLLPFLGLILLPLQALGNYEHLMKIAFWIMVGFILIFSYFQWKNRMFNISNDMIRISEGVFRKYESDVPFNRIKSINTSDTMVKRLLNLADLNVELIGGKQVQFVMSVKDVQLVKESIFIQEVEETEGQVVQAEKVGGKTFLDYILMGVSNKSIYMASISIGIAIITILTQFIQQNFIPEDAQQTEWETMSMYNFSDLVLWGIITMAVFMMLGMLFSSLVAYLTYSNFNLAKTSNELSIKYGRINKKDYLIPKSGIRSLEFGEPYLLKLFGRVQLRLINVGLKNGNDAIVVLCPIIKKADIPDFLEQYLPEMEVREASLKPEKWAMIAYVWSRIWKLTAGSIILTWVSPELWYLLFVLPVLTVVGYMDWRAAGFSYDKDYVTVSFGSVLGMKTIITPKKFIESTAYLTNPLSNKKGTGHYLFAVYSENLNEEYNCSYIKEEQKKDFLLYLKQ